MSKLQIKKDDTVVVISGDSKGTVGKVIAASPEEGKVIVAGANIVSKHTKARRQGENSQIIKTEGAIYACKVQVVCPKCNKPTRVGTKIYEDGKKDRMCKKCGETF